MERVILFSILFSLLLLPSILIYSGSIYSVVGNSDVSTENIHISTYNNTNPQHLEFNQLDINWPMSKDGWVDELNLTSTFGPRQKASEDFRFDFHRGLDLPAPYGTPVYAVADGIIRLVSINSTHQQRDDQSIDNIYTSNVIQIKHNNSVENKALDIDYYYSNYLHVNESTILVNAGASVTQGELIGYVGDDPNSNFPHLHFEIREDGLNHKHTTHPLQYLQSRNSEYPQIDYLIGNDRFLFDDKLQFIVNVSNQELDFVGFHISGMIGDLPVNINYDMIELNHQTENALDLDNEALIINSSTIIVYPYHYSNYKERAVYNVSIDLSQYILENNNEISLQIDVYDLFDTGTVISLIKEDSGVNSQTDTSKSFYNQGEFLIINFALILLITRKSTIKHKNVS